MVRKQDIQEMNKQAWSEQLDQQKENKRLAIKGYPEWMVIN